MLSALEVVERTLIKCTRLFSAYNIAFKVPKQRCKKFSGKFVRFGLGAVFTEITRTNAYHMGGCDILDRVNDVWSAMV